MRELFRDIKYFWFVHRESRVIIIPLMVIGQLFYWFVVAIEYITDKRMSMGESKSDKCSGQYGAKKSVVKEVKE